MQNYYHHIDGKQLEVSSEELIDEENQIIGNCELALREALFNYLLNTIKDNSDYKITGTATLGQTMEQALVKKRLLVNMFDNILNGDSSINVQRKLNLILAFETLHKLRLISKSLKQLIDEEPLLIELQKAQSSIYKLRIIHISLNDAPEINLLKIAHQCAKTIFSSEVSDEVKLLVPEMAEVIKKGHRIDMSMDSPKEIGEFISAYNDFLSSDMDEDKKFKLLLNVLDIFSQENIENNSNIPSLTKYQLASENFADEISTKILKENKVSRGLTSKICLHCCNPYAYLKTLLYLIPLTVNQILTLPAYMGPYKKTFDETSLLIRETIKRFPDREGGYPCQAVNDAVAQIPFNGCDCIFS